MKKHIIRVGIVVLLAFMSFLSPTSALPKPFSAHTAQAYYTVMVYYTGLSSVQLYLDFNIGCSSSKCSFRLMDRINGIEQPAPLETSPTGWSNQSRQFSVSNGTHAFRFEVDSLTTTNPPTVIQTYYSDWTPEVTVDGSTVGGTLLFDETLTGGNVACKDITVPAGRTLSLSSVTLTNAPAPAVGCSIYVHGSLNLSPDTDTSAILVTLYSPQTYDDISKANFIFQSGSGGSSIAKGHDFSVQGNSLDGLVIIKNSQNVFFSSVEFLAGGEMQVTNITDPSTGLYSFGPGKLAIADSVFDAAAFSINKSDDSNLQIKNNLFQGIVSVYGGTGTANPLILQDNHFATDVQLYGRTSAELTGNSFVGPLIFSGAWCDTSSPEPVVQNNSFVGRVALRMGDYLPPCDPKIAIGANYYGDQSGYTGPNYFLNRGAIVNPDYFSLLPALKSDSSSIDARLFPTIWLNDYRIVQGTSAGQLVNLAQGKDTLISLDLVCSDATVNNVMVWAVLDGVKYPKDGLSVTLHRDTHAYGPNANYYAKSTVNLILPAVKKTNATLQVWLDTTNVSGYTAAGGAVTQLTAIPPNLYFSPPPGRKLQIVIVPVQLGAAGPLASVGNLPAILPSIMAAMFPITPDNITVRVRSVPLVDKSNHWSVVGMLNALSTQLTLWRSLSNSYAQQYGQPAEQIDYYIAVLPAGSMGNGVDGASMPLRRNVIFVDEKKLTAVIHEMGHTLGLYNTVEQYNWPNYPDNGQPLVNITAFSGLSMTGDASIDEQFGSAGRIRHLVDQNNAEYNPNSLWYDMMGAGMKSEWPLQATSTAFANFFSNLPVQPILALTAPSGLSGYYQIAVTMQTQRVETVNDLGKPCIDFQPTAGTVRVLNMGAVGSAAVKLAADSPTSPSVIPGELPLCGSSLAGYYIVESFDASGHSLSGQGTATGLGDSNPGRETDYHFATFLIPTQTTRLKISLSNKDVLLDLALPAAALSTSATPSIQILEPAAAATLGSQVKLRWTTTGAVPTGQPLQTMIFQRTSATSPWQLVRPAFDAGASSSEEVDFPTDSLPASNQIAFKVVATDGLRSFEAVVDNLTLPNRAPIVTILSPQPGDRAVTGTLWTLQAMAVDPEDGMLSQGVWSDSVQGQLGTGATLSDVLLNLGNHTLTYSATDSGAKNGSAQMTISVGGMATVDLSLNSDALVVQVPQRDPSDDSEIRMKVGLSHQISLSLRNVGTDTASTLSLYVTPPGGSELLLVQNQVSMAAFEQGLIAVAYTPLTAGAYIFRGVISGSTPGDGNPSNDTRAWNLTAVTPPTLSANVTGFNFGNVTTGQTATQTLTLTNNGGMDMLVRPLSVAGTNWQTFSFRQDHCSYALLGPGETCTVEVAGLPRVIGPLTALLAIPSTDPAHSLVELPISMNGVPPKQVFLPFLSKH